MWRDIRESVKVQGRGWRKEKGSLQGVRQWVCARWVRASWEAMFTQFITSRKSAPKKEQIMVPVSFRLNIEGPQRSKTILERELQGGEEKVLCTPEEMGRGGKQYCFNVTATIFVGSQL